MRTRRECASDEHLREGLHPKSTAVQIGIHERMREESPCPSPVTHPRFASGNSFSKRRVICYQPCCRLLDSSTSMSPLSCLRNLSCGIGSSGSLGGRSVQVWQILSGVGNHPRGDRRRSVLRSQRNTGDRANFARAEEVISVPNERTEPNECTLCDRSEVVKMAHRLVLHSGRLASQGRQRLCSTRRPRAARVRDQPCGTLAEALPERHAERVHQLSARR